MLFPVDFGNVLERLQDFGTSWGRLGGVLGASWGVLGRLFFFTDLAPISELS